jgi:hypothetical protein
MTAFMPKPRASARERSRPRTALDRLVDQCRADVPCLEQHRLESLLALLGDGLGHVEHPLGLL